MATFLETVIALNAVTAGTTKTKLDIAAELVSIEVVAIITTILVDLTTILDTITVSTMGVCYL